MLAVVDTNVWVSAFLTPGGTASKLLDAFEHGKLTLAYSGEVEAEYREVLSRPKFRIAPELVAEFLEKLRIEGRKANLDVHAVLHTPEALPDPNDAPCIALALFTGCPVVTGNARHFPPETGVEVLTLGECLGRIMG
jgi:uncharacterized protein